MSASARFQPRQVVRERLARHQRAMGWVPCHIRSEDRIEGARLAGGHRVVDGLDRLPRDRFARTSAGCGLRRC